MSQCTIVDEPRIEGDAVVVRVVHEDPAEENSGRVFVCRMTAFDTISVEPFPKGQTPHPSGEHRRQAAEAVRKYAEENLSRFEELFEELARRQASSD
jgi:hypothetical protein